MAITYHPRPGQILLCDFSQGFKEPEMIKSHRPVIVLTPPITGRAELVTVLALSTKEPDKIMPFHYKIPKNSMPQLGRFQKNETWVKGDMIYTVGFHRLDLVRLGQQNRQAIIFHAEIRQRADEKNICLYFTWFKFRRFEPTLIIAEFV